MTDHEEHQATPAWDGVDTPSSTTDAGPVEPWQGVQDQPASPHRSKKRLIWPIASGVIIAALAVASTYLWMVHSAWVEQNDQLRAESAELGELLAQEQLTVAELSADLDTTRDQLATAQERVHELAGIEANATDDRIYMMDISEAFIECIRLQDEIIDAYRKGYPYSINRSAVSERVDFCDSVEDDFSDFKKERDS